MAALKNLNDYKSYNKGYPSDNIDPKLKKEKRWYIDTLSSMLGYYMSNNCEIPFDLKKKVSFSKLNAYAQGRQGNWEVKRKLLKEAAQGKFKTKMKDVFQTFDVLPEFFDVIRAFNQKEEYEVNSSCFDYDSVAAKELERATLKFLIEDSVQDFIAKMGITPKTPIPPEELQSMTKSDIDLFFDTGGYVTQREIESLAVCSKTKQISGYKEIENNCNDDLIKYGIAAVENYIDESTREVKMRHVDFLHQHVIIPYSQYNDFRDITRYAILKKITIAEIKEINPNLTAEDIQALIERNIDINPEYASIRNQTGQYLEDEYRGDPVDKCKLWVMVMQWLSVDNEVFLKTKHPDGNDIYKETKYDYKLNNQEIKKGVKLKNEKKIKKYEATWIVGSDILLRYGSCEDVVYYGKDGCKTPKLDLFVGKTGNTSLVERCMVHVDDINLYATKLRQAVATLPPAPRMLIQQQLLDNVFLNGIKQQPEDLIQTLIETGYLITNGLDDHGNPIFQNSKAIEFIHSGLAEDVTTFNNLINEGINRIRQVLGLPEGLDGTAGNPYQGKAKQEMAAAGSSNAMFPTLGKLTAIFNPAFNDVVKKWQVLTKYKPTKMTYSPLGNKTTKILEIGKDFSNADLNIELVLAPNSQQKEMLMGKLEKMNNDYVASQGAIGVSFSEYLMVFKLIMDGSLEIAMFKMAQIEKKREKAANDKAQQNQQFTIQSQQQSAVITAQQERITAKIKESEIRNTAIVTEAQKRKTAAISQYMKSFDILMQPIPQPIYDEIMNQADEEISGILAQDQQVLQPQQGQDEQDPQQGQDQGQQQTQEQPMQ